MKLSNVGRWVIAGSAALLLQAGVAVGAEVKINAATAYAADNFQTRNLQAYADDVARMTKGAVRLTVHPAGTLLKPAEIFSGVREGKAEAGEVIMSSLAGENPMFGMDSLPFIASGYDDARLMWEMSRATIARLLHERGLQLLYAVPWPPQNLYSRQPINGFQDFKGLRMRVYSPATERIAQLAGATPVRVEVVDLADAIAGERLDFMLTSSWTGVETRAWSKLQHYYRVNAWIPKNIVFVSRRIFDKLDAETQRKMTEAAGIAEQRGWTLSQASDQHYENQLAVNKIVVSNIDPFLRRYLDRIGEKLTREWLKQAHGDELRVLLQYTSERSIRSR